MCKYCEKYKWARLINLYTGKIYKNKCGADDIPEGWLLAFGDMMFEELDAAIKKAGVENSFVFRQVKEKFGTLTIHHNQPRNSEIDLIIRKYSQCSRFICMRCGKPNIPMVCSFWIRPMCEDCYIKTEHTDKNDYKDWTKDVQPVLPDVMNWEEYKCTDAETNNHIYEKFSVDISETVAAINKHWEERVLNNTHIVVDSPYDKTYTAEEVFERLRLKVEEDDDE